jgi:beta-glucosidase
MPWVERPAAIVETYLGGQAGGLAVVDVLFGDTDPAGRLAETFPIVQSDVAADAYFPGEPRQVVYGEGLFVGYRYFDGAGVPVRFPFGHGLSYTTFAYGQARLSAACIQAGDAVTLTVPVRNTGERHGAEVVQVYVRRPQSAVVRPDKELRAFAKVWLAPGEAREVTIRLDDRAFAHYEAADSAWHIEAGAFELLVGSSSANIHTKVMITALSSPAAESARLQTLGANRKGSAFPAPGDLAGRLGRPLPSPEPSYPFHRNSTFEDLAQTRLGRVVQKLVLRTARQQTVRLAAGDPALLRMFDRATLEAPLRAATQASAGRISFAVVDAVIDLLNHDWGRLLRRLRRRGAAVR